MSPTRNIRERNVAIQYAIWDISEEVNIEFRSVRKKEATNELECKKSITSNIT